MESKKIIYDNASLQKLRSSQNIECLDRVITILNALDLSTIPKPAQLTYSDDAFLVKWPGKTVLRVLYEEEEDDYFVVETGSPRLESYYSKDVEVAVKDLENILNKE